VTALREGAGTVVRKDWAVVEVTGKDAQSYLHRMLTQDVKSIAPMRAKYACVLTPKGKILGDPVVWNLGDRYLLDMARAAAEKAIPALERTVIADDVVFRDATESTARFAVVGGREAPHLFGARPPPEGEIRDHAVVQCVRTPEGPGNPDVRVLRRDVGRVPCLELLVPSHLVRVTREALPAESPASDVDALRVEEGIPAYGAELDDRVLPNEAGLESALSWTKGCYPGQEPVVMARHRGHPPSLLVRLEIDAERVLPRDAPLLDAGKPVGRVTSSTPASTGGLVGMGYVLHALAKPGASFEVEGGGRAKVVGLVQA
jgi:folate-binding protein YgfZ